MLLRIVEISAVYITKNYKLFFNLCGTGMLTVSNYYEVIYFLNWNVLLKWS